jgi:hypothetical protein
MTDVVLVDVDTGEYLRVRDPAIRALCVDRATGKAHGGLTSVRLGGRQEFRTVDEGCVSRLVPAAPDREAELRIFGRFAR